MDEPSPGEDTVGATRKSHSRMSLTLVLEMKCLERYTLFVLGREK